MNSNPGENRELDALVNQPKETHKKGLLLGTDFRHAVEFSRSGRSRHPAGWAFDRGGCSTLRHSLSASSGGSRDLHSALGAAGPRANSGTPAVFPGAAPFLGRRRPVPPPGGGSGSVPLP